MRSRQPNLPLILLGAFIILSSLSLPASAKKEKPAEESKAETPAKDTKSQGNVEPILSLQGNMANYNALQLATLSASSAKSQEASIDGRPLVLTIRDEKTYQRIWNVFSSSILASEPISKPSIDFDKQGAVFVMPYESRGGGKPPSIRDIRYSAKKQRLLLEFNQWDLPGKNNDESGQMVTSVMGNPWYFGVFPTAYLQNPATVRIRN